MLLSLIVCTATQKFYMRYILLYYVAVTSDSNSLMDPTEISLLFKTNAIHKDYQPNQLIFFFCTNEKIDFCLFCLKSAFNENLN